MNIQLTKTQDGAPNPSFINQKNITNQIHRSRGFTIHAERRRIPWLKKSRETQGGATYASRGSRVELS